MGKVSMDFSQRELKTIRAWYGAKWSEYGATEAEQRLANRFEEHIRLPSWAVTIVGGDGQTYQEVVHARDEYHAGRVACDRIEEMTKNVGFLEILDVRKQRG